MIRVCGQVITIALALVFSSKAAAPNVAFVDSDAAELIRAVPELADIQFDQRQDGLAELLNKTGEKLSEMFANFVDVYAAEEIHEMRFEKAGMLGTSMQQGFRYVVRLAANGSEGLLDESRIAPKSNASVVAAPQNGFLVADHFVESLYPILPRYRGLSRFRYLGRYTLAGQEALVVAFAQGPAALHLRSRVAVGRDGRTPLLQGLIWIDAGTYRILRVRLDLLAPLEDLPFETLTTDVTVIPVTFSSIESVLWLPLKVTVDARSGGTELYSVYRYSDYHLYAVDDDSDPEQKVKNTGIPSVVAGNGEDARELLARAIGLINEEKSAEAVSLLRQALTLDSKRPELRYHLGVALRAVGDLDGAEVELREAAKRVPGSAMVHNNLGVLLFQRENVHGAQAEFREASRLEPKDPTAHVNLARALVKQGDMKGAVDEYRAASLLAPNDAGLKARYEELAAMQSAVKAPASETTIKVDVRQVLVPLIVTDKEGHHITGLKQEDFRVFEDGVEQKVSAFAALSSGLPSDPSTAGAPAEALPAAAPATPNLAPGRRTYLIVIDTLHTAFPNFVHLRDALQKLFREEQAGDSQYSVMAIARSLQVVQNTTRDPAMVLKAIESKEFQKIFQSSQKNSLQAELDRYRRELDETRVACDRVDPDCPARKMVLPPQANSIAELDRSLTTGFLRQFRFLIEQIAHTAGRKTIVLMSDGFSLTPGKAALEYLVSYFPENRSAALQSHERIQGEFEPVVRLAATNNIPIYTVDSRGLYTNEYFDPSNHGATPRMGPAVQRAINDVALSEGDTLAEMAAATGGAVFHNSNDLLSGLRRAFADGREYYTLAYVSSKPNMDGKFRAIRIEVRDPKALVNAKRGYWASGN